jgi:hypothetical protein
MTPSPDAREPLAPSTARLRGGSRRRRRALGVLALFGSTLVGLFLLSELAIKLYFFGWHASPTNFLIPSEDPLLIYELRPNTRSTYTYLNPHQRHWEYSVHINEQGFRGRLLDETSRRPRVLVLGDSYAFGFGVDDDATFAHRLGEMFEGGVDVLNWGVPGYNLIQEVELLHRKGLAYEPDIVVLAFHPNDFEPPVFRDANQVRYARWFHLYGILMHLRWEEQRDALLESTRPQRVRQGQRAFDLALETSRRQGFELQLFQASCWSGWDDPEVERFFERCRRQGLPTIDLDARFCARFEEHTIPEDGHPTARGHEMLATKLFTHLEPRLRALMRARERGRSEAPWAEPGAKGGDSADEASRRANAPSLPRPRFQARTGDAVR